MGSQESNNGWQNNGEGTDFKRRAEELIEFCEISKGTELLQI